MQNIQIKEIEVYHPETIIHNDFYIQHFKERGRDITHFLEAMGKRERFIISNKNENTLTMAIEASNRVLEKAKMTGEDIDYIVFSSQVPEYTFPTNAMFIHDAIGAHSKAIGIDTNANCAGMTVAIEQAVRYMMGNPNIQRALVVGSEHLSLVSNPEEEITYATYADAACAVILEKTDEDSGFVDAAYNIFTENVSKILYPVNGLSQAESKYIRFQPFDASFGSETAIQLMQEIVEKHNIRLEDISAFCFSQFAYGDKVKIQEALKLDDEKVIYIGDKYGYTGTSSPLIAMYEGIQSGKIKRGDYVMFWTVGAGHQFIAMLFKY